MLQNFIFPQVILTLDGSAWVASSPDNVVPLSVTAAPVAITDAPTPLSGLPKRCEVPVEPGDLFDVPDLNESVNGSLGTSHVSGSIASPIGSAITVLESFGPLAGNRQAKVQPQIQSLTPLSTATSGKLFAVFIC
jgi:hypothetical protein